MDNASEDHCNVRRVLCSLVCIYDAIQCDDYRLPDATQVHFETNIKTLLLSCRALHIVSLASGSHAWHEVPKFHCAIHLAFQSRLQNPRVAWSYPDEDFMHIVKEIAESCMSGTAAEGVVPKLLLKWAWGVAHQYRREGL